MQSQGTQAYPIIIVDILPGVEYSSPWNKTLQKEYPQ